MKNESSTKPLLAITMGDPAGIGPEISIKALSDPDIYIICRPLLVGSSCFLKRAAEFPNMPAIGINSVSSADDALFQAGTIDILDDEHFTDAEIVPLGQTSAAGGDAAFRYVKTAIELAKSGIADGTVTNPLNKEALHMAGHNFAGHTEIYAHFTDTDRYTMLLAHGNLRVVHVSTHVSLREACDRVKMPRVLEVIRISDEACRGMGIENPKIAVAGLNPHSGENGLFGREELDEIIPAINAAKADGINVDGPVPPDSVFPKARGGFYDIVVAMYHDQGHIPLKTVGFVYDRKLGAWQSVEGVNITLGLPIIRTSVDHGTAFDQAGAGTSSSASLMHAIEYAANFADQNYRL